MIKQWQIAQLDCNDFDLQMLAAIPLILIPTCICLLTSSRSSSASANVFVPIMLRIVVCASSLVDPAAFLIFVTDLFASIMQKYTTASTVTVTLSLVSACHYDYIYKNV